MHNRIKLHAFFFGKNNERKGKSMIVQLIENIYQFLWGEWIHVPLPGGGSLGLSLLIILLLPAGIVFTIKTKFLPIRLFPDMVKALTANNKNGKDEKSSLSSLQTLIVSTATRVGMGNLTGVVAAISAGGAGAVFWMWITALLGSSTAFIEATLAQLHKEKDPLYGGYRGGPAYYIHHFMEERQGKKKKLTLNKICTRIENICTASRGEIILVLDGLIKVMNEALSDGESVHLGEFGSFRMVAGSKGSATVDGFTTALFNRAHIVFYPGTMLINLVNNVSFERYVPKKDASSESAGSGGGTDDRPGEL